MDGTLLDVGVTLENLLFPCGHEDRVENMKISLVHV